LSTKAASFVDNRLDKVQQNAFGKYGTADFDGSNGRWPANVLLSHSPGCVQTGMRETSRPKLKKPLGVKAKNPSENSRSSPSLNVGPVKVGEIREQLEIWQCVDDCPIWMLDGQSGNRLGMSGGGKHRPEYCGGMFGGIDSPNTARGDSGGASRFYYQPKVGRAERDRGLDDLEEIPKGADALRDSGRGGKAKNNHPTLKPVDLCRYFARMLLPPPRADGKPRRILVPYAGSGSEMCGCLMAGWDEVVGIELDPKHAEKARLRISKGRIISHAK
jgi:hypothetical protein